MQKLAAYQGQAHNASVIATFIRVSDKTKPNSFIFLSFVNCPEYLKKPWKHKTFVIFTCVYKHGGFFSGKILSKHKCFWKRTKCTTQYKIKFVCLW